MENIIDNKPPTSSINYPMLAGACVAGPVIAGLYAVRNTIWQNVTESFSALAASAQQTGQSMIEASQTAWENQSAAITVGTVVGSLAIFSALNAPKQGQEKASLCQRSVKTCSNAALSVLAAGSMSLACVAADPKSKISLGVMKGLSEMALCFGAVFLIATSIAIIHPKNKTLPKHKMVQIGPGMHIEHSRYASNPMRKYDNLRG